jgi:hypothetical protein
MLPRILRFVRLPLLLIFLFAVGRFTLGLAGVPYAPRGNAIFSIVVLTLVSSLYWGALSGRVGGFSWMGAVLVGITIGLFAQLLVFSATLLSYALDLKTSYFLHWDALNVPEGTVVPMSRALVARTAGLVTNTIIAGVAALIGRSLGALVPGRHHSDS